MPAAKASQNDGTGALRGSAKSRALAKRLVVGELPSTMRAVKREARAYRRNLEDAVLAVHGEVDTLASHLVDTASAATMHAGICRWLLRNRLEDMTTADIRGCSGDIIKAKQARDAAVKQLKLDAAPPAPWEFIVQPSKDQHD